MAGCADEILDAGLNLLSPHPPLPVRDFDDSEPILLVMVTNDDTPRSGLADAAGRAAFFTARAAARAWRGQLEEAVDEVL